MTRLNKYKSSSSRLTGSQVNMTCNMLMLFGFLALDSSLKMVCFSNVGRLSL